MFVCIEQTMENFFLQVSTKMEMLISQSYTFFIRITYKFISLSVFQEYRSSESIWQRKNSLEYFNFLCLIGKDLDTGKIYQIITHRTEIIKIGSQILEVALNHKIFSFITI
jgi:hypothetical protein